MRHVIPALGFILLIALPSSAAAHSAGPLDRYGCHADRRRGDYHCHRGEFQGRHFKSKAAMLDARRNGEEAPPPDRSPGETSDSDAAGKEHSTTSWFPFFGRGSRRDHRPPAGSTVVPRGIEERLRTLKDLYEKGLITEEEYAAKRKEILGEL